MLLKAKLYQTNNYFRNYKNQLSENWKNVYLSFKVNIWGVYLADIHLISIYNKGFCFLLIFIVNTYELFL